jgi:hypothetical protein
MSSLLLPTAVIFSIDRWHSGLVCYNAVSTLETLRINQDATYFYVNDKIRARG